MKSSKGERFLSAPGIKKSINQLIEEGHDPKIVDQVGYENAVRLSDISYNEGYRDGMIFEREKEDYDTYMLSQFKKISVDGLPLPYMPGKNRSKVCVCFCPPENPRELGRYIFAWYSYEKKCWEPCLGEIIGHIEPEKYLELPEIGKQMKQYDVHLQSRSTNCFPEIPDGVYQGEMGGHVILLKYLDKPYNFTFLKGVPGINVPKTITIIDGWGYALLLDGPITPNFIDNREKKKK